MITYHTSYLYRRMWPVILIGLALLFVGASLSLLFSGAIFVLRVIVLCFG
jgi:hypothetical protein